MRWECGMTVEFRSGKSTQGSVQSARRPGSASARRRTAACQGLQPVNPPAASRKVTDRVGGAKMQPVAR